jgi:hypothetical protein
MKKVLALAAFVLTSLAATSAHAQSTISPVPGAPDRPHETAPTTAPLDQVTGQTRSDGQMTSANGGTTTGSTKMRRSSDMAAKKEARKEMKMKKKSNKTSTM